MSASDDLRRFDEAVDALGRIIWDAWEPVLRWVARLLSRVVRKGTP